MRNPRAHTRAACASIALVATFWAASFGLSQAQSNTLDVSGTVTANDGTPIAGATVALSSQRESPSARSDAHGSFVIAWPALALIGLCLIEIARRALRARTPKS